MQHAEPAIARAESSRSFWITVLVLWLALGVTARYYPLPQSIPLGAFFALAVALGLEATLYAGIGFRSVRNWWASSGSPASVATALALSGLLPYLAYSIGSRTFTWQACGILAAMVFGATFWYVIAPQADWADLLFLAAMAVVSLTGAFKNIYIEVVPKPSVDILGNVMWIRIGILSVLLLRRAPERGFGFVPRGRDWRVGFLCYLAYIPVLIFGSWFLHLGGINRAAFTATGLGKALAVFMGFLWVAALSEEFFIRGMLQPMMVRWLKSDLGGLVLTSVIFGLLHLPFRGFPNWTWVGLATLLGLCCGTALLRTGSLRAAMVTHALVVVTWRSFLSP